MPTAWLRTPARPEQRRDWIPLEKEERKDLTVPKTIGVKTYGKDRKKKRKNQRGEEINKWKKEI